MSYFLHRQLVLNAFETIVKRRKTFPYWAELERTQWLPRSELETLQFAALQRVVSHAYNNCDYYRQAWKGAGQHPAQLQSPTDFHSWPVIDRDTIRLHRMRMRAPGIRLITKSTGGSSGVPLQFDLDLNSNDHRTAAWHRGYTWAGAAPGTRQLYLWGSAITRQSLRSKLKDRLYQKLQHRRVVSCFDGENDLVGRFVAELDLYRPDVVVAYTNPLYEVARQLDETGRVPIHRPQAILVGAEKLHSFQRQLIEKVFQSQVYETYGSREFMLIAAECEEQKGLHLTAENLLVEVLDDDGRQALDGTEGNVVITDLYNYGMPFIRYANGDRAISGSAQCKCGRGLPVLKKIVGRQLDMLTGTGGRTIPGEFFPHLVKEFPAVSRFQVVQEEVDRVRFSMVAKGISSEDRSTLERLVRRAMGDQVWVDFETVSEIPLTPAGKLQVVINKVPLKRAG